MAKKNYFKSRQILITGGLGFIGSNLALKLVELGANITVLDSLLPDFGGNKFNIFPIKNRVNVKIADMRNQRMLEKIVGDFEIIFNLAGTLSHIDSMTNPLLDLDINCVAQLSLLQACRKNNRSAKIIFTGTRNQYGKALYLPVDEKHIQEPTDINGINAMAAEKYHFLYTKIYGVPTVSLRLTNTFGPRHQMKHSKQGVLNWFLRLLLDGKKVELYGDGTQIRDVNYVDDVVNALILAAENKKAIGKAYNLGGQPVTLKQFVEESIKILDDGSYLLKQFPQERKAIEIGNYVADIGKIKTDLNWEPKIKLEEGIKRTINYYKKYKNYYWK